MTFNDKMLVFNKMIAEATNIVVFTGAGVSTNAGLPDFRSADTGLYSNVDEEFAEHRPEDLLSRKYFDSHTDIFFSYLQKKLNFQNVAPTLTHTQIAKLGKVKNVTVVTQNIDTLHQDAGSKTIYTIHGTLSRAYCESCEAEYDNSMIYNGGVPRCPKCHGIIRPDITLYGEMPPQNEMEKARRATRGADLFIIVGSSMTVSPANLLPFDFYGDNMVIINRDSTPMDRYCNLIFHEDCDKVFGSITIPQN